MRHKYSALLSASLLVFLSTFAGCGGVTNDNSLSGTHGHPTDRLEHHQAAHHPGDYATAVTQIELRHARIQDALKRTPPTALMRELRELLDILEWLPLIAADSDLKKPDWETVNRRATQLTEFYASYVNASSSGQGLKKMPSEECHRAIESLRALVPSADRRP